MKLLPAAGSVPAPYEGLLCSVAKRRWRHDVKIYVVVVVVVVVVIAAVAAAAAVASELVSSS
jgi:hypothetical protein